MVMVMVNVTCDTVACLSVVDWEICSLRSLTASLLGFSVANKDSGSALNESI